MSMSISTNQTKSLFLNSKRSSGDIPDLAEPPSTMRTTAEISSSKRDLPPANYSLKVESYSLLLESKIKKYDTGVFEAGGHKWRLSFYPNGKNNGNDYISLYLEIAETDIYPSGWEVNVNFKLFVYDQIRDKYLTIQGVKRFHEMKKEWGFAQFLALETFTNSSNGYLVDDCCVFGTEVFVINYSGNCETISMVKMPLNFTFTWEIKNFSKLNELRYYSQVFNVEGVDWSLVIYPNGTNKNAMDESFSLYMSLADWKSHPTKKPVYAEYRLRALDQVNGNKWFKYQAIDNSYGYSKFMRLKDLYEASKGFIVNDTLIVEVDLLIISVTKVSSNVEHDQNGTKQKHDQNGSTSNCGKQVEAGVRKINAVQGCIIS
ncbi:hypothetical protein FEM48_Zijuj07G0170100 [Ziziphus jujuba var. spinosa]|uniref:MATH domain-containing protein n=1 Tax=Ziziphus jujuba var. spinosa TaxID=714518 RepID=A0A978V5V3_ZIZJJ|nr:hypothetical protein FEM48_Zijuj07G0170100 [Ziziphus jujuba var. spinosa]